MSSKYSTTAPTHKPLPWCKKAPRPPIIPIGGYPKIVQASLRFYQCLPSGAPRALSFYLPNIKLTPTGHGAATAVAGAFTAYLSIWYDAPNKRLVASADVYEITGPIAVLQTTIYPCPAGRPLMADLLHFTSGIPPGQDGRLQCWE